MISDRKDLAELRRFLGRASFQSALNADCQTAEFESFVDRFHPADVSEVLVKEGLLTFHANHPFVKHLLLNDDDNFLNSHWLKILRSDLVNHTAIVKLWRVFAASGIDPILMRGVSCKRYYRSDVVRDMGDNDLLVEPEDLERLENILKANEWQQHPVFLPVYEKSSVMLDIHTEVFGLSYRQSLRFAGIIPTGELIKHSDILTITHQGNVFRIADCDVCHNDNNGNIAGSIQVRVLGAADDLICTTVHWVKHSFAKLGRAVDIAMICKYISAKGLWDQVIDRVNSYNIARLFLYGLETASRLIDAPLPEMIQERIATNPKACLPQSVINAVSHGRIIDQAGIILTASAMKKTSEKMQYLSEVILPSRNYRECTMNAHGSNSLTLTTFARILRAGAEVPRLLWRMF